MRNNVQVRHFSSNKTLQITCNCTLPQVQTYIQIILNQRPAINEIENFEQIKRNIPFQSLSRKQYKTFLPRSHLNIWSFLNHNYRLPLQLIPFVIKRFNPFPLSVIRKRKTIKIRNGMIYVCVTRVFNTEVQREREQSNNEIGN